ncbi:cytochrome P450 [Catellatospora sp. TT07R-123]|uniref:cytochrome P450 n=1 Tax=Catellatospora sp. TT07R-123 TaxID=2733863 RepID=UPI001B1249DD|nr:cytochrome P450 [Catellatospora sp. TT07R-123]GHJ47344.1 cytochrome P450 [Catellatospora sp. TT07R-123]
MTLSPPPPIVPGIPLLGNALQMMGDVQQFLVDSYHDLGPVFRVRALNQPFVIMAGAAANRFLIEHGEQVFTSEESFGGLDREFGMRVHVLRGRPHRHLRKLLATGLSRDLLAARWDQVADQTEQILDGWADQPAVSVVDACQRLAAAQLSIAYTGASSAARFETLRSAFELVLDVTIAGKWPAAALRWPSYRRSRAEIHRFARAALAERAAGPRDGTPDLLDLALDATDEHGVPYPLDVRAGMALQGYFAGVNTVAYLYSFMIDVLLRNPAVLARVRAEVDAAYHGGRLSFDRLRDLPALHGLVMETLRVHPPAPGSARTATQGFDFAGFRIERGQRVLVATCVTHQLPEHFPDPQRFDLDRDFAAARSAAVYAPFSVGGHTCLGAGMTQVLSVATTAMLVRRLSLSPMRPERPLRITATPGPNPGRRFKVNAFPRGATGEAQAARSPVASP